MLRNNSLPRHQDDHPAEAAQPAMSLIFDEDGGKIETPLCRDRRCETPCADPEHTSKFIKGLVFALPASITFWAGMILGLKAIF